MGKLISTAGSFIDPYGAPEFFCSGLAFHQMAGPGIVRFVYYEDDGEPLERIVRVKLLLPLAVVLTTQSWTREFLSQHSLLAS